MSTDRHQSQVIASLERASRTTSEGEVEGAESTTPPAREGDRPFRIASLTMILLSGYMIAVG